MTPAVLATVGAIAVALVLWWALRRRGMQRGFVSERERATYETLHTASRAGRELRDGARADSVARALPHLREMLDVPALAFTSTHELLAWDGAAEHHKDRAWGVIRQHLDGRRGVTAVDLGCDDPVCAVDTLVVAPITVRDSVVGALVAGTTTPGSGLTRATVEVAGWCAGQLELAELSADRTRTMEAELRALRAQISPHFIYNALGAIASYVRTDPEHARELILEFADFTRYSLRTGDAFAPLSDELRNVERYLTLEQARFGDRLRLTMKISPEVLPVNIPYLSVQPLVENAVRHGIAPKEGPGTLVLTARDLGSDAEISVEDDGVGADPDRIRKVLDGDAASDSVGLSNVDARLRQVYGNRHGVVVETAPGAGTKVSFRVPKFTPGT